MANFFSFFLLFFELLFYLVSLAILASSFCLFSSFILVLLAYYLSECWNSNGSATNFPSKRIGFKFFTRLLYSVLFYLIFFLGCEKYSTMISSF